MKDGVRWGMDAEGSRGQGSAPSGELEGDGQLEGDRSCRCELLP